LLPEPVVSLKAVKEFLDVVLGALDGTGQEKNDLNDFLILSNPVVEWLSLVLRDILLVPVLNTLGGLEHVTGSSVDSTLHFLKGRLELAVVTLKVYINLEEGLKDLLRGVSSAANSPSSD